MVEQARLCVGNCRLKERIAFALAKHGTFEKRNHLVENSRIARDLNIMRYGIGEPAAIVRDARANAAFGFRQPPMLHVAFDELARGGPQKMRARQIRPRHAKRHHVLQLIAEPVGAACLVETGARPDAARQRLIRQPAVQENVQRTVRSLHLYGSQSLVPLPRDRAQHGIEIRRAIFHQKRFGFRLRRRLTEKENDLGYAGGTQPDRRLQRAAGIEPGADPVGQGRSGRQAEGAVQPAVAADHQRFVAVQAVCRPPMSANATRSPN